MIELNLKDIVLKADFTPLQMGQTEKEVVKILGKPGDRSDNKAGSVMLIYGCYEFFFFDNELHYFQNDNLKYQNCISYQNNHFKFHPWFVSPNKDTSMKEVISLLENEGADFSIENQKVAGEDYRVGEVKFLELSNGVSMNFENTTTASRYFEGQKEVESEEILFTDEMDFVLYAIRYEHWNLKSDAI